MTPTTFLYKSDPVRGRQWAGVFRERAPEIDFRIWPDIGDPALVRFLAAWEPPQDLATRFPQLQVLFSSGAGWTSSTSPRCRPSCLSCAWWSRASCRAWWST